MPPEESPACLLVLAHTSNVRNRLDPAEKHIGLARELLQTIEDGSGQERFQAAEGLKNHLQVIKSDAAMALNSL